MTGPLSGRTALVTGAGQGVGRGIALALAEHGASVCLAGRTEQKLAAVAAEIADLGGKAHFAVADVTRPDDVENCVAGTVERFGGLDILVNNAQQPVLGSLLDLDEDDLRACWESGPLASFRFMRACHRYLRGGGVVINLGSSAAVNPQPAGRGGYAAVKAATHALSRAAATEWGADGIRVLTVLPASTSPAAQAWAAANPDQYAQSLRAIPIGRLGDPLADIGRAVAFLCGPDAGFLTGTTIALDGGQAYLR